MAQLMPLPLTVSCSSKIQIGFTFLVAADLGTPGKRAVKRTWYRLTWVVPEKGPLNGCVCTVWKDKAKYDYAVLNVTIVTSEGLPAS